ncbi:glycosyltransferase [Nodosilinea sp. LEGE 06152]|uniref:glycosyltransferase n=1 Tax=Nodosilinea sp. LEGE 06152 TaxID=2777966 RepID=UPI001882A554|nr:glycosyltransferase [Nodosilinea sp. LEGE 06152]MBE9158408.1 glycosyltransferase [Nodosilinea sp. LEGE 06152]
MLLIVLTSLCAEGTPVLVLELCRWWLICGIRPTIVLFYPQPNDLAPEFEALGIPLIYLQLPKAGLGRYAKLTKEIYQLCYQLKPSAVLSMPLGWHTCVAYGAKCAGVKRVAAHVGNYPPHWSGLAFQKFRLQIQLGRPVTDRLICCSNYIRQGVLAHFNLTPTEAVTIYNGCPFNCVANPVAKVTVRSDNRPFIVGMVARLEQHKDQPTLIRAAGLLKNQGFKIQVNLVGEGRRRKEYETLIDELSLQDTVYLLGMRRDIPSLLQQMDAFVFSAKPDEGFGIALVEAMAAGVPIVATDVGACREILQNGLSGILVKPESPEHLAKGILTVMNLPYEAAKRTQIARERAQSVFSIEAMAQAYSHELRLSNKTTQQRALNG